MRYTNTIEILMTLPLLFAVSSYIYLAKEDLTDLLGHPYIVRIIIDDFDFDFDFE